MPSAPRTVWMPGGVRTEVQLGAEDTGGAFCLLLDRPPAGWALPPHLHRGVSETIHVVEGEFEVVLGGQRNILSAGQTIHVPADVVHSSANVGSSPGQRVLIFSPGGMEEFFLEVGAPAVGEEVDQRELRASALRHGWEFAAASAAPEPRGAG